MISIASHKPIFTVKSCPKEMREFLEVRVIVIRFANIQSHDFLTLRQTSVELHKYDNVDPLFVNGTV